MNDIDTGNLINCRRCLHGQTVKHKRRQCANAAVKHAGQTCRDINNHGTCKGFVDYDRWMFRGGGAMR